VDKQITSVVITAYNTRPGHLLMAVRSALSQTCRELEVIVSDDSGDRSLGELVSGLADPRVRYRHNSPALGVALNHWTCFREARGKYIAVLNHDDWIAPTFVERLAGVLEEHPECALAFCDHWVMDVDGNTMWDETERNSEKWGRSSLPEGVHRPFYDLLASQTVPMAVGAVFRRELLPKDLPDHAGPAYDLWLASCLCQDGLGAYYVRDRLSSWRNHAGNLTSRGGMEMSYAAAECWRAIASDSRLASIRRVARYKAALALRSCALNSWLSGRRASCLRLGLRSVRSRPTYKGLAACMLPLVPKWVALRQAGGLIGRRWGGQLGQV
jgi:glycosyltransferase involved in cell wall biosynthesis